MRRIQLHLDENLDDALASEARQRGMAKAALVREYLWQHVAPRSAVTDDPSARLIGSYPGAPGDSESVDQILYGR